MFTFAPTEIELTQKPSPITNQQSTVFNFDYLVIFFEKRYPEFETHLLTFVFPHYMQSHPFFEDFYNVNHSIDSSPITG